MNNLQHLGVALNNPTIAAFGTASTVSGIPVVEQAIKDRLDTPLGTRFFNQGYGSRIHLLQFAPNDEASLDLFAHLITEALADEGRIKVIDVQATQAVDSIEGLITYRIKASNEVKSMIYPYYLR